MEGNVLDMLQILKKMDGQLTEVKEKLLKVDEKLSEVDEKLLKVDEKLLEVDEKLFKVDEKLLEVDEKLFKVDEKLLEVDEKLLKVDEKLLEVDEKLLKVDEKLLKMDEKIDTKVDFEVFMTEIKRLDKKIEDTKKEILDQQFAFEHEYGLKIDAIFDAVSLEMDKNIEKSQKIYSLSERIDRNEVTIFNHGERISKLELKQ